MHAGAWAHSSGSRWQVEHDCGIGMPRETWPAEIPPSVTVMASSHMICHIRQVKHMNAASCQVLALMNDLSFVTRNLQACFKSLLVLKQDGQNSERQIQDMNQGAEIGLLQEALPLPWAFCFLWGLLIPWNVCLVVSSMHA